MKLIFGENDIKILTVVSNTDIEMMTDCFYAPLIPDGTGTFYYILKINIRHYNCALAL